MQQISGNNLSKEQMRNRKTKELNLLIHVLKMLML